MAKIVAGKQYESITGQLFEIGRQLRQPNGYPFNPEKLKGHLQDAIEGKFGEGFPVWKKTIKLGTGLKTADDFRKALKKGRFKIGNWGNDILGQSDFTTASRETEVELVQATVAELGFKDGARLKDIYERAPGLGLGLCPNEVGPQLRLQYKDQPRGEWLSIAMEPITDSGGNLHVFYVGHVDFDLWLSSDSGYPGDFSSPSHRWVFVRRKYK